MSQFVERETVTHIEFHAEIADSLFEEVEVIFGHEFGCLFDLGFEFIQRGFDLAVENEVACTRFRGTTAFGCDSCAFGRL